jgi:alkaline phosphatase D
VGYPSFTTSPTPGEKESFAFAFGSCFRPNDARGGQIFRALEKRRTADGLRFILLTGDQIYADCAEQNGIGKVACSLQDYRDIYAYTWSRPPFRELLENLPAYMTLDDHEVDDDWRWTDATRRLATIPWWDRLERRLKGRTAPECELSLRRVQAALQAYWEHQGMHAPGFDLPPQLNAAGQYELLSQDPGSLAYTFTFGAAAFFVLDTRTMRVCSRGERTMLGEGQWQALKIWLKAVKDAYPVKFLITSCSLLHPMWNDIPRDRWSGFPDERDRLLHYLAANGIEGVFLLAGDLHSSHAVYAELYGPDGRSLPLWEFCSTPFEQDPNRMARFTYAPLRSGPVRTSRRAFCVSACNFGVVRVEFNERTQPHVEFQVYGIDGELLGKVDTCSNL